MFLNFFLIPICATFIFITALYPLAVNVGFTDKPCHRKQHKKPIPLIGGLAIYLTLLASTFLTNHPLPHQIAFVVAATILISVGLIDDYRGLGVKIRLIAQIAAGLIMTQVADIKIDNLGDLLGFGELHLGFFASAFTVFAIVGGINAFNMVDGMDGLAGSLSLISIASLAGVSWISQDFNTFSFCLIFIAALIAFLSLNLRIFGRSNAKIFLGDSGSTLLGFTICWLAIGSSQGEQALITPPTVLWIMALPLMDSVCIMLRRLRKGRSPFQPDREHLHHIFHVAGLSNNLILKILVFISLSLAVIGLTGSHYLGVPKSAMFWLFLFLFATHYWLMSKAWTIMKITRFLLATRTSERRVRNIEVTNNRRSGVERRLIPTENELEKYHQFRNGNVLRLRAHMLRKKSLQTIISKIASNG
jgi:UDP-GlcNAc:undecaprenyl-phosphate/decaprenyl-phosphate GlcNAc-1-phosphate transferase